MSESEFRDYCLQNGVDLDELALLASRHFQDPEIHRRTAPLTEAELAMLAEDDEQVFGNKI